MDITTAVIPVAGSGSRMFPTTTAVEKCMLPIYAAGTVRPVIDYVVQDCVGAGIQRIIFITTERGKSQLQDYFGNDITATLRGQLERLGKQGQIDAELARRHANNLTIEYIFQPLELYGTTVPPYLAKAHLAGEKHFALITGDDFIYNSDGSSELKNAIADWRHSGFDHAVSVAPLPKAAFGNVIHFDGQNKFTGIEDGCAFERWPADPQTNTSRYIFSDSIWPYFDAEIATDRGDGEHLITYPVTSAASGGETFYVHRVAGKYLDGGRPETMLAACRYIDEHPPVA